MVTGFNIGDFGADGLNNAGGFMARYERHRMGIQAFDEVQV